MIVVVLFKVIAATYLQCATKFLKKLSFLYQIFLKNDIDVFPSLQDFVASTSVGTKELVATMNQHL